MDPRWVALAGSVRAPPIPLPSLSSVLRGGPEAAACHPGAALLLVYPPPEGSMAEAALALFLGAGGSTVAYVGEWDGDTGTPGFERGLLAACDLAATVPLPNWGESRASLTVWRRRRSGDPLSPITSPARMPTLGSPLSCGVCGLGGSELQLWRCRLTGVLRCSDACAAAGLGMQADEAALRLALLPPRTAESMSAHPASIEAGAARGPKAEPLAAGHASPAASPSVIGNTHSVAAQLQGQWRASKLWAPHNVARSRKKNHA